MGISVSRKERWNGLTRAFEVEVQTAQYAKRIRCFVLHARGEGRKISFVRRESGIVLIMSVAAQYYPAAAFQLQLGRNEIGRDETRLGPTGCDVRRPGEYTQIDSRPNTRTHISLHSLRWFVTPRVLQQNISRSLD